MSKLRKMETPYEGCRYSKGGRSRYSDFYTYLGSQPPYKLCTVGLRPQLEYEQGGPLPLYICRSAYARMHRPEGG